MGKKIYIGEDAFYPEFASEWNLILSMCPEATDVLYTIQKWRTENIL